MFASFFACLYVLRERETGRQTDERERERESMKNSLHETDLYAQTVKCYT